MNDRLQLILDSTPNRVSRSRLEPYWELIIGLRNKGYSYQSVRDLLKDKCGVQVSVAALREFVKRRSQLRKPEVESRTPVYGKYSIM